MTNYLILILGYLLIFVALILSYYRFKKTEINEEDFIYWSKLETQVSIFKNKLFNILKISEKEVIYLWINLIEKILRRIKIFGLKIETWAGKNLEKMKNNKAS